LIQNAPKNKPSSWLLNLSASALIGDGENILVAGFVTSGTAKKSLLVRGIGPSLNAMGVADYLSNPVLTLFNSGDDVLTSARSWDQSLAPIFQQAGAFPLTPGSNDAAFEVSLEPGSYTTQLTSATETSGVALAEIFDLNAGDPTNRLVNLSARAFVGPGSGTLVGGFVVGGTSVETLLIRADGPGLGELGVMSYLANPVLTILNSAGEVIDTVTGWGPDASTTIGPGFNAAGGISISPATSDEFAEVGAFDLKPASKDCALVVTVPAGAYTAEVTGAQGETGIALVEIYELN
jgi:hypothetical protein